METNKKSFIRKIFSFIFKPRGFLTGLIFGFLMGILFIYIGIIQGWEPLKKIDILKNEVDALITDHFFTYTAQNFEEAILGEASNHRELIVMEQPLELSTTITKAGLANLEIFSKTKNINYYGKGIYTIDLNKFSNKDISVDNENNKVIISIPHAVLQYVNIDLEKTEFEDTEKGFLAFGDIALTMEQQNQITKNIEAEMRKKLDDEELYKQADELANYEVWKLFQPIVTKIAKTYTTEIVFK